MMRNGMVLLGNADVRVGAVAGLMTDHEREDAADVALIRQVHQVIGHGHVIVEGLGQPDRRLRIAGDGAEATFHPVELLLHLADVAEILVENGAIGRPERAPQLRGFLGHRVQQALLFLQAGKAPLRRIRLAEHSLEGHARIDRHGQRARIVAPGERVEERAGETVAGAHRGAHVLGADLDRPQRCIASDLIRDVLIDGLLRLDLPESVARSLAVATGPTPFRNAELAPRWTDAPQGAFILLTVTS